MSQGAILYISFFGVKKCDMGHENTSFLVVIHLISVGCLGPTLYALTFAASKATLALKALLGVYRMF